MSDALFQQQQALKRAGASSVNVSPNFGQPQAVIGPDGKPALAQFGKGGQVQIAPGYRPYSQKADDAKQQREQGSKSALDYLNEAEKYIGTATGSGIGAAVDSVGRMFGASTKSSEAAARLKAIQGALMMAQPRMEGPQSDKDVQLYREMAGNIGDPSIPPDEKRAAIETIRALHQKYVGGSPAQSTGQVKFLGFE